MGSTSNNHTRTLEARRRTHSCRSCDQRSLDRHNPGRNNLGWAEPEAVAPDWADLGIAGLDLDIAGLDWAGPDSVVPVPGPGSPDRFQR